MSALYNASDSRSKGRGLRVISIIYLKKIVAYIRIISIIRMLYRENSLLFGNLETAEATADALAEAPQPDKISAILLY